MRNWGQSPASASARGRGACRFACIRMRVSKCVVPPRARPREVEAFIAAHREWIESRRAMALRNRPEPQPFPPARIDLRMSGEQWRLQVAGGAGARAACAKPVQGILRATGGASTPAIARRPARLADARRAHPAGTARGGARSRHGRELFAGFHPPAAFALGKLFGAGYHQPQLLPAVPAPRSGGLPHRARAHAREAHEPLGAFLAGGGTALRGLARARSRARAGLAPRASLGFLRRN